MKLLHLQLFWYEKHHTLLEMEDLPILTPAQEQELREWAKTRRKILSYEVHQQPWVKVNVDGFSSILELKPNGTLVEKTCSVSAVYRAYGRSATASCLSKSSAVNSSSNTKLLVTPKTMCTVVSSTSTAKSVPIASLPNSRIIKPIQFDVEKGAQVLLFCCG